MGFKKLILSILGLITISNSLWATTGWNVDTYGNIKGGRSSVILSQGQSSNCHLAVSGSTLSVVGFNLSALSTTNPCVVGIRDENDAPRVASFKTPVSVTFGSSSDTDGNLFGITNADWASAMPFKLGAISKSGVDYFIIYRRQLNSTGGAATDLCQLGDVDCDAESDVMVLTTGATLSNLVGLPITQLGWFRATYATSGSAWTFSIGSFAGFNFNYEKVHWTMPTGQNGAVASYHFNNTSGANNPTYANAGNIDYTYTENRNGTNCIDYSTRDGGNASAGTGANQMRLMLPYAIVDPSGTDTQTVIGRSSIGGSSIALAGEFINGNNYISLYSATGSAVNANSFSNTGDDLAAKFCYSSL